MNFFRLNILLAIQGYRSWNSRRCQPKGLDAAPPGIVIPFKLYKKQDTLSKQNRNYPIPIENGNWLGLTDRVGGWERKILNSTGAKLKVIFL